MWDRLKPTAKVRKLEKTLGIVLKMGLKLFDTPKELYLLFYEVH
jgi:hypothetical protein